MEKGRSDGKRRGSREEDRGAKKTLFRMKEEIKERIGVYGVEDDDGVEEVDGMKIRGGK